MPNAVDARRPDPASSSSGTNRDADTGTGEADFSRSGLAYYALPAIGTTFSFTLTIAFITKYATDVLLIAPFSIGLVLGASRIWDAVTDPLIGNLSDRTSSRLGRRRPWLLASAVPFAVFGFLLWQPPQSLTGAALTAWMTVAILAYFTASTAFMVPHYALGAELTRSYHRRTSIFAVRGLSATVGSALALVYGTAAIATSDEPRETAFWIMGAAGILSVVTIGIAVAGLRERAEHQGRGGKSPARGFRDVWANPHGRRLLIMLMVEHTGGGSSMVLTPYLLHYVIGDPGGLRTVFLFYTGATMLAIPLWALLSRRIGKKPTWLIAMGVAVCGYATLLSVGHGDLWLMCAVSTMTGSAAACGRTVGLSIQADVIDHDEYTTGERKEGSYYSAFTFLEKTSSGIMAMMAGFMLSWVGFVPNVEQSEETQWAIRTLMGTVPLLAFLAGAAIFSGFRLTQSEHARIAGELEERRASAVARS